MMELAWSERDSVARPLYRVRGGSAPRAPRLWPARPTPSLLALSWRHCHRGPQARGRACRGAAAVLQGEFLQWLHRDGGRHLSVRADVPRLQSLADPRHAGPLLPLLRRAGLALPVRRPRSRHLSDRQRPDLSQLGQGQDARHRRDPDARRGMRQHADSRRRARQGRGQCQLCQPALDVADPVGRLPRRDRATTRATSSAPTISPACSATT